MASSAPLSEMELLRDYLTELLKGRGDLAGVAVLSRRSANLVNEIERALSKDNGLLALVILPAARPKNHQSAAVAVEVDIIIRITENVLLNKSGRTAMGIACSVVSALQLHNPAFPWARIIQSREPGMREINVLPSLDAEDDSDDYAGWDCFFRCEISLTPRSTTN